jgi:hypothetical protein
MVLVAPTSVDKTGTGSTATINSSGSVTFDTCTAVSLNGIFTADYDNYMIVMRLQQFNDSTTLAGRLRVSGTDSTATTDYNTQQLTATATSIAGARNTNEGYWRLTYSSIDYRNGQTIYLYGPKLAQPTAFRNVTVDSFSGGYIYDTAGTHELSTAYDGITVFFASTLTGTFTGLISVYGLVGA